MKAWSQSFQYKTYNRNTLYINNLKYLENLKKYLKIKHYASKSCKEKNHKGN